MTENSLISIIVPVFNRSDIICNTLKSISNQSYSNWECIIVDDESTDNTKRVVADYIKADYRFHLRSRPTERLKGANACRNYGFEISRGDFIQWFDSDDIMFNDKIETQLKPLVEDDSLDFSVCEGGEFTIDPENYFKKWDLHKEGNLLLNHIKNNVVLGTNGPLFRRSYLQGKELFNESLPIRQEWEFFNRLLINSPKIVIVNKVLYAYRSSTTGIRGNRDYPKMRAKMITSKMTLDELNKSKVFDAQTDFIYRRFVFFEIIGNLKIVMLYKQHKDLSLLGNTLMACINGNFIKNSIKAVFRQPKIMKNVFKSISS